MFQREISPSAAPWPGSVEVSIVQSPGKMLSGVFVRVWSPMFDRDRLQWKPGSKGLPQPLGMVRSLASEQPRYGRGREELLGLRTILPQEQMQANALRLKAGESCHHYGEFSASFPMGNTVWTGFGVLMMVQSHNVGMKAEATEPIKKPSPRRCNPSPAPHSARIQPPA